MANTINIQHGTNKLERKKSHVKLFLYTCVDDDLKSMWQIHFYSKPTDKNLT